MNVTASQNLKNNNDLSCNEKHSKKTLVTIKDLSLREGRHIIFEDLDFSVNYGDKITIVGENGIGKSTFLRLIRGEIFDHQGIVKSKSKMTYLPQSFEYHKNKKVLEYIIENSGRQEWIRHAQDVDSLSQGVWLQEFNKLGGHSIFSTLNHLKIEPSFYYRNFIDLSGGEKTKIHLCAIAHSSADLLLLDEPTNHLDIEGIKWLERYLKNFKGGLIMVTHDRTLINRTSNRIAELSPHTHNFIFFRGGYQSYLDEQDKARSRAKQVREKQEDEIKFLKNRLEVKTSVNPSRIRRKDGDKLSFNARGERQQKGLERQTNQIHNKLETLKENLVQIPEARKELNLVFQDNISSQDLNISVYNLSFSYPDRFLFKDISFQLKNRDRLVIIGPNGSGKTSLLKILVGIIQSYEGILQKSSEVKIGFLDQEQETMDLSLTPLEYFQKNTSDYKKDKSIILLKKFGVNVEEDLTSDLSQFSIGYRRKVQLASMVASKANVLILDEPTNHMDITSLEQIEDEMMNFPGIIIAVSHDRYFIDKIATQTIKLTNRKQDYNES